MNGRPRKIKKSFGISWKDIILYGFLFIFLLFVFIGVGDLTSNKTSTSIPISRLVSDIKSKKVSQLEVSDTKIDIKYKNGKTAVSSKEPNVSLFEVLKNSNVDPSSVKINVHDDTSLTNWVNLISAVLPVILIVAF